jgi:hypothetical protein
MPEGVRVAVIAFSLIFVAVGGALDPGEITSAISSDQRMKSAALGTAAHGRIALLPRFAGGSRRPKLSMQVPSQRRYRLSGCDAANV